MSSRSKYPKDVAYVTLKTPSFSQEAKNMINTMTTPTSSTLFTN